jgi:hypothetical protein
VPLRIINVRLVGGGSTFTQDKQRPRIIGELDLEEYCAMKRVFLALSASSAFVRGAIASANALEVHVRSGRGLCCPASLHYYDYYGDCRVVITHPVNRWGEDVTVRRRICD